MLDEAGFALLVLTGESERTDGVVLARQNVVHEAGLFQGRLGWRKAHPAIVALGGALGAGLDDYDIALFGRTVGYIGLSRKEVAPPRRSRAPVLIPT
jgi:hypothetical protein